MTTTDPTIEDPASGLVLPPSEATTLRPVKLAESLVEHARPERVELVGPGGMLSDLTKRVLGASLEAETDDHFGYPQHDPADRDGGGTLDGMRGITLFCFASAVRIRVVVAAWRRVGMGTSNLPVRQRGLR